MMKNPKKIEQELKGNKIKIISFNLDFDILIVAQFICIFHFIFIPKNHKSPGRRRSQLTSVQYPL